MRFFRLFSLLFLLASAIVQGQGLKFTHDDTLRGSITPERAWWDLTFYHLNVRVHTSDSTLSGSTTIRYRVLKPGQTMQVDLQRPLRVLSVEQDGKPLKVRQDGNAYFVTLTKDQKPGQTEAIRVVYAGKPRVAKRPPWDGGLVWSRDRRGEWFIATACQGLGASAWWPCKDHMYDEPDSMAISVTVPENLMDVSNGQLRRVTTNADHTRTFDWYVSNPINNYGVNLNIGRYEHWSETYAGAKGSLPVDYYALTEHLDSARTQFRQVPLMLKAFEHWFGPYPFYEDGYKLVDTPYLGMEHQSSVTYGNRFRNGYLGRDLSKTGWGLLWDFIIVHESGHEWFANNITYKDVADMWIHESFTNYSECLFTEYYYGKDAGAQYVIGCRANIRNDSPIIGTYNVNNSGSGDMYYKGGNMLHMIRQLVGDDERWRQVLRGMNKTFYHQTVTASQIEQYMIRETGKDLKPVFDQYLRDIRIPVLEYRTVAAGVQYRWANIRNDSPIIGTYNVNNSGSGDMYYKGGNMLHMIRQLVGDDERWRQVLRGMNKTFYHQTVTASQIEQYMIRETGKDLKPVFDQYLRDIRIPVLEYRTVAAGVQYRWANCIPGFDMPVRVCLNEAGPFESLKPTERWQTLDSKKITTLTPDANYYVLSKRILR